MGDHQVTLIFFTSTFPYPPGEQFIEAEIKYIAESKFEKKLIFPHSAIGLPRKIPSNIYVHEYLYGIPKLKFVFKAAISQLFLKEVRYLISNRKLSLGTAKQALIAVAHVLRAHTGIKKWCDIHGPADVAYVYWNATTSYAACLAKKNGLFKRVVTRAHGHDLYEEIQKNNYMPLKRQFVNEYDKVHALSDMGRSYLISRYSFSERNIQVSPLGVEMPLLMSRPTKENNINLVSVSFCVRVKRIDKIIESIAKFASENSSINIKWRHIGGGVLLDNLKIYASEKFNGLKNVDFLFVGHKDNKFVLDYYQENDVDFFINLSESEGVPVSIMECMAAGIPAIATNVGGVSSVVNINNGYLLDATPGIWEVSEAIGVMMIKSKDEMVRNNAQLTIKNKNNAQLNYRKFVAGL